VKLAVPGGPHLTYCTNIHPGETWAEVRANLERHVRAVKASVAPSQPFGVGLRLSAVAASTLAQPAELEAFSAFLRASGLYVFTINGFPYGPFHGTRVKEEVYLPDWLDEARLRYTDGLADLLAALLPDESGLEGTVSTVPGAYKARVRGAADAARMAELMVCFDACHMAVEFEDAAAGLEALRRAGIRVGKVQVSAGLRLRMDPGDRALVDALRPFAEGVYLHQVVERRDGRLVRYLDLPEALEAAARDGGGPREWRIHFHVPLFREELGRFASTQDYLRGVLHLLRREAHAPHLEVETYTWNVLPEEYRREDIAVAVARELRWVLGELKT
jgi:hypothetical protein